MIYHKLFAAAAITVGFVSVVGAAGVTAGVNNDELGVLAARLDLSARGTAAWLQQLERNGAATERLLAVTTSGELVMAREGGRTAVAIGVELDLLLRRPGSAIVLIHNHPSNTALSAADIGQLSKPGVAAVVAICRDGSVFMAAAGPRMDGDFLESHQYLRRGSGGESANGAGENQLIAARRRPAARSSRRTRAGESRHHQILGGSPKWRAAAAGRRAAGPGAARRKRGGATDALMDGTASRPADPEVTVDLWIDRACRHVRVTCFRT